MKALPSPNKIGLGIVTYNRPDYFQQCLDGVAKHMGDANVIWTHNDGSTEDYSNVTVPDHIQVHTAEKNGGVAKSKNWLLRKLLDEGCDYIFLLEDDVVPISDQAIAGYIDAANQSKLHHYNFAHHGIANDQGPAMLAGKTNFYHHFVGAYSMYTRPSLEEVGLFDEKFHNAWEHVELSWRLAQHNYSSWPLAADARDSKQWLQEIPGSIENSSIRHTPEWRANVWDGFDYWKEKDPAFPLAHLDQR